MSSLQSKAMAARRVRTAAQALSCRKLAVDEPQTTHPQDKTPPGAGAGRGRRGCAPDPAEAERGQAGASAGAGDAASGPGTVRAVRRIALAGTERGHAWRQK